MSTETIKTLDPLPSQKLRWLRTDVCLPPNKTEVLIWSPIYDEIQVAYVEPRIDSKGRWFRVGIDFYLSESEVTHWMRKPLTPEEQEESRILQKEDKKIEVRQTPMGPMADLPPLREYCEARDREEQE